MSRFIEGADRHQSTLLPDCLDDHVAEENAVRVADVFVDELELSGLWFRIETSETGRPGYHPATLLKRTRRCWFQTRLSRSVTVSARRGDMPQIHELRRPGYTPACQVGSGCSRAPGTGPEAIVQAGVRHQRCTQPELGPGLDRDTARFNPHRPNT